MFQGDEDVAVFLRGMAQQAQVDAEENFRGPDAESLLKASRIVNELAGVVDMGGVVTISFEVKK